MLDVAVSYNRYKFLGHEFLTWLWYAVENQPDALGASSDDFRLLEIGNRIVLENYRQNVVERMTLKGDQIGLEEAMLALKKGAVVTELHLIYKTSHAEWQFSIKGESLNVSSFKTPQTGPVEHDEDKEGLILEKIYLYEKALKYISDLYKQFISLRVTDKWAKSVAPAMKKWITS